MAEHNVSVLIQAMDRLTEPVRRMNRQFGRAMDSMRQSAQHFRDSMERAANLSLAAQGVQQFSQQATSLVSAPVQAAMDLESAMADVRKVVDFEAPDGPKEMAADLSQMSKRIPIAAEGLAEIAAAGGQLGVSAEEIPQFTETVSKMATAFDMSTDKAGEAMAKMSNVYQIPVMEIESLGDAVNHLSNTTAAKASEIVEAMNRIGGTARQFGLSANQAAALSDAFIALGEAPERAGTTIRAMLLRLQSAKKQPKAFQQALSELGMSASDLQKRISEDAQGALQGFLKTLSEVDKQRRAGILTDLFGREHAGKIATLVGSLGEYQKALGKVGEESAYVGSMQEEFETRADTTQNALQLLKNRLDDFLRSIGNAVLPVVKDLTESLGGIVDSLTAWIKEHPELTKILMISAGAVAALTAVLAPLLLGLAALTVAAGGVRTAIDAMPKIFRGMGRMARWTAGRVSALVTAVRGADFSMLRAGAARLATGLRSLAARAIPAAIGGLRALGAAMLTTPVGWIVTALAGAAFLIYKYWQPIAAFLGGVFEGFIQGVRPAIEALRPLLILFQPLISLVSWLASGIGSLASWLYNLVTPVEYTKKELSGVAAVGRTVGMVLGTAFRVVLFPLRLVAEAVELVASGLRGLWNLAGSAVSGLAQAVRNPLDTLMQAFWNFSPVGLLARAFDRLTQWLFGFSLFDAGKRILSTLASGIKSMLSAPLDAIKSVAGAIRDFLPFSPARRGPLSDIDKTGQGLMRSMARGIRPDEVSKQVDKSMRQVRDAVRPPTIGAGVDLPELPQLEGVARFRSAVEQPDIPELSGAARLSMQADVPRAAGLRFQDEPSPAEASGAVEATAAPAPQSDGGITVHAPITIHAAPGMDERQIAERVRSELDRAVREAEAGRRGALHD